MPLLPAVVLKGWKYALLFILAFAAGATLHAQLQANFNPDKSGGCFPLTVNFTNLSTAPASATYLWDFGNGNTSALKDASAIFIQEQPYTVKLTVTHNGQSSTKTMTIEVYKRPTVNFTANSVKGCIPFDVTFTAQAQPGSGSVASYYWDYGDGFTGQAFGPTINHIYNTKQPATVNLTVKNNFGCATTVVKPDYIDAIPSLTVDFDASKQILCQVTDPVQFTNKSKGPGTLTYSWDFGDAQTSTQANPSHSFSQRGNYTVKLTANSSEGCTATRVKTDYLNVANYTTTIQAPATACRNSSVNFVANCYPQPNQVLWEIDGIPYSYFWTNFNMAFNTPGQHTIKVTATYGTCTQTATHNLTVYDVPNLQGFEVKVNGECGAPVIVDVNDTSKNVARREWNFDYYWYNNTVYATTQQASYNYIANGSFQIALRTFNAEGCSSQVVKGVTISRPIVNVIYQGPYYGHYRSCEPFTLTFEANTSEKIVSYKWTVDNNVVSTDPTITQTFSAPGNHFVRLDWETDKGCKGVTQFPYDLALYQKAKVDFTSLSGTTICANSPVTFQSSGTGYNNGYWIINGNYLPYYGGTYTHQFNDTGVYTVQFVGYNSLTQNVCNDTATKVNYIKVIGAFPRISAVQNSCDDRSKVEFSQSSRYAESLVWDFGDGQKLTTGPNQATVTHNYAATGRYNVSLTAVNGQCSVRETGAAFVLLKQKPLLTATASQICADGSLNFTISNLEANPASASQYYIERVEYSDGTRFNGYLSNYYGYLYTIPFQGVMSNFEAGKTGIRIILREQFFNCSDTTNILPLTINGSQAGFRVLNNDICFTDSLRFQDTSKVNSGNAIVQWEWNFGDGQTLLANKGGTVAHLYANPGNYYVTLRVKDAIGCTVSSAQAYVRVNGPKAAFNAPSTVPFNLAINFNNTSNDFPFYRATYQWDFGDGNTSAQYYPQNTFAVPGRYTVRLTAADPVTGCTSTASQEINVQLVNAYFNYKTNLIGQASCPPVLTNFTVTAFNVDSLSWDFGDGTTAGDMRFASHVYEKPGKYIVTLTARGANNIIYRYLDSVIIKQPTVSVAADDWDGCPGHTINLNLTGTDAKSFAWDFGDGSIVQSPTGTISHTYPRSGVYTPSLLVEDANGCLMNAAVNNMVTIFPTPQIVISPASGSACLGVPLQLSASGAQTYVWSPAAGLDNPLSAQPIATPAQTTTYRVNATDARGCTNYADYTLTVRQPFKVQLQPQVEICEGKSKVLLVSGAHHYNWINTTTGLSNTQSANPIASPAVTTTYTVVGYDDYNCFTDTAQVQVIVNPKPTVNAGADVDAQPGDQVQLSATGSGNVVAWSWTPANYLSCTNCQSPVSKPLAQTIYKVTGTTAKGCEATDEVLIKMQCSEARIRIPNAFTPNGDKANDYFVVKGISMVRHMVIYNRWGNKVFERSNFIGADESACWDGTFNGIAQPAGTYVYVAEVQCPGGELFIKKGTVTLVR